MNTCLNCKYFVEPPSRGHCVGCYETEAHSKWEPSRESRIPASETTPRNAPALLHAAQQHMQDRAATYDKQDGERSMARTVAVFNSFHDLGMTEAQGWHFMQILKDVRLFSNPDKPHRDSIEDGIAYAALKGEAMLNG